MIKTTNKKKEEVTRDEAIEHMVEYERSRVNKLSLEDFLLEVINEGMDDDFRIGVAIDVLIERKQERLHDMRLEDLEDGYNGMFSTYVVVVRD